MPLRRVRGQLASQSVTLSESLDNIYRVHAEGCRDLQTGLVPILVSLSLLVFSLFYDAFAQSELMPSSPGKCNNALYSSELLNARFGELPSYHMEHYVV